MTSRQEFPHLSDAHWAYLEKMSSLIGEEGMRSFLSLSPEQQLERISRFEKYESSLIAHIRADASAQAQEVARESQEAMRQELEASGEAIREAAIRAAREVVREASPSIPSISLKPLRLKFLNLRAPKAKI